MVPARPPSRNLSTATDTSILVNSSASMYQPEPNSSPSCRSTHTFFSSKPPSPTLPLSGLL